MTILPSLLSGVVSGVLASLVFLAIMQFVSPKLMVSKNINSFETKGNITTYKVKIVNKSKVPLSDVRYSLYYYRPTGTEHMVDKHEIKPNKNPLFVLEAYDKKSVFSEYAVRVSFDVDTTKYPVIDRSSYFVFAITATHSISGTKRTVTRVYESDEIKKGTFASGVCMDIM